MADPVTRFTPDRQAYVRTNAWLAAFAMAGAMAVLWLIGSPYVWTGAVAGLAAIAVRSWYLASEELAAVWEMDRAALTGPGPRRVPLDQIAAVKTMGSFVQIVTKGGDKHLIKYQAEPAATKTAIERALP
ncbi:hypothetical protein FGK63_04265 [Ruegeria sediminis]|uniref:PH domain-containing protein n=1 Tax=Ruegeria sediminis TaxID=2583820 RepID=A0ABY2X5R8_9RHOB|nr:hypothetical protein [Ruegeria sediminis]TMV10285.1 hypothetical protein FGK63_04265 [Ruegeria sediminis]